MKSALTKDHDQAFWQLASIQAASLGLPGIFVGKQLANELGAGTAIISIFVSNLILWIIGLVIISMTSKVREHAIDNIKEYIGVWGGIAVALVLVLAFLDWYVLQINSSVIVWAKMLQMDPIRDKVTIIKWGAVFSLISTLLIIGGIKAIKWITVYTLPLLFCYHIYSMINDPLPVVFTGTWGISFFAIISTVLIELPGFINLPTFFRHSRSRADSYLALTLMALFITFFQATSIWMQYGYTAKIYQTILFSSFIVITLTNCNLLNIYFASACWETIIPRFSRAKGFAIIGLLGTLIYTFIQISSPMLFFERLASAYIATLGGVLLIAFIVRIVIKHRPRVLEKTISSTSWLLGCIAATFDEIRHPNEDIHSFVVGIATSALFFLIVIFIEETFWSAKKVWYKEKPFKSE